MPHPSRSIASDGRVIQSPLRRISCLACGAASHAQRISDADVNAIFDESYSLATAAPKSDAARGRAYADWICKQGLTPRSILEVGCGSGSLLRELAAAWPRATCFGIDPALPEADSSDPRLRLARGFVDDIPADSEPFDLIIAINVIEHVPSPVSFLTTLYSHLAPGGHVFIVCPRAEPPNVELLFHDHIHSLTPRALTIAASATPLKIRNHVMAPLAVGDFQLMIFNASDYRQLRVTNGLFQTLLSERRSYLYAWSKLDDTLLSRLGSGSRLIAFGAGQMAAVLHAYAPRAWERIEAIMLDDVSESWMLDKPVEAYQKGVRQTAATQVLLATSPHVQGRLAARLSDDGWQAMRWDDLIPR
jgi:2-polyprenyl-3-methyl-5-hydroxy-6-metoxy-1,4-benzoquinol methylase